MSKVQQQIAREVIAIVPTYTTAGDSTRLILASGEEHIQSRSVESYLREFWRIYSFDWPAYRKGYQQMLGRRNLLPWPADIWRTFAPLKLRRPLLPGDAAYGYVVVEKVEQVLAAPANDAAKSYIMLQEGVKLPVHLKPREVRKHLQAAAWCYHVYWGKRMDLRPAWVTSREKEGNKRM